MAELTKKIKLQSFNINTAYDKRARGKTPMQRSCQNVTIDLD